MKKNFSGKKNLSKIFLIVLISSCSILSKNMFRQGEMFFNGGRHLSESWNDKIKMKRFSWFQELSLSFDFIIGDLKRESNFLKWIDEEEEKKITSCNKIYVSFYYVPKKNNALKEKFFNQLPSVFHPIELNSLKENLRMHPDFSENFLDLYKFKSFCLKINKKQQFSIFLPGYNKVNLKL
tara:strand:- start:976 stop:1515 length:540 start_codon:yes stop_codon:yes gene_type:complete